MQSHSEVTHDQENIKCKECDFFASSQTELEKHMKEKGNNETVKDCQNCDALSNKMERVEREGNFA